MKVKVNDGWQLGVDGKLAQPGDEITVDDALGEQWVAAGQATAVKAAPKAEAKMVAESKNKAVPDSKNKAAE